MHYNFTDRIKKVLDFAREEAIRLQHEYVGTEHILLGLLREGEGVAAAVLTNIVLGERREPSRRDVRDCLEMIREKVEDAVRPGNVGIAVGELPYTSRAKKVLEFAMAESREFNHSYVGTEHVLLGLLREEKGIAAEVLNQVGVSLEQARRQTLKLLGDSTEQRPLSKPSSSGSRRRGPSTSVRVFARSAIESETLSLEIQGWISEQEEEGFSVADKSTQVVDGFVIITVWMQR